MENKIFFSATSKETFEITPPKMINKVRSFFDFIFQQKDLPKWIVNLNYISLAGIVFWPFVAFGSIFILHDAKNFETTLLEIFLVDCYPVLLLLISFASFKLFRLSKFGGVILPAIPIIFYVVVLVEYVVIEVGIL